jgi:hypothetical protein
MLNSNLNEQLIQAAKDKNVKLVTCLLAQGADANRKRMTEECGKHTIKCIPSTFVLSDKPSVEIVQLLLEVGAEVNTMNSYSNGWYF